MSDDLPDNPELEHVLDAHWETLIDNLRTAEVGRILSYDSGSQTASVRLEVKRAHVAEDGTRVVQTVPDLNDRPVMFWGWTGGRITWPIPVGAKCLVVFTSSSTSRWELNGQETDPGDDRRHDLSDGYVLVGPAPASQLPNNPPSDRICLDGPVTAGGTSGENTASVTDLNNLVNLLINPTVMAALGTYTRTPTPTNFAAYTAAVATFLGTPGQGVPGTSAVKVKRT